MKKFLAMILALVMVMSLCTVAFAGSPTSSETGTPVVYGTAKTEEPEYELTSIADLDKLSEADKEAFEKFYEEAKADTEHKVLAFFWFAPKAEGKVVVPFEVEGVKAGDKVIVMVNGVELSEDAVEVADGVVTVTLTEAGAVAIMTEA